MCTNLAPPYENGAESDEHRKWLFTRARDYLLPSPFLPPSAVAGDKFGTIESHAAALQEESRGAHYLIHCLLRATTKNERTWRTLCSLHEQGAIAYAIMSVGGGSVL